ncbi:MAG: hypothetical protein U1E17_15525 [Geminicoccaceae bacterium]
MPVSLSPAPPCLLDRLSTSQSLVAALAVNLGLWTLLLLPAVLLTL